jgi:small-conductance mechanosensitive channel
MEIVEILKNIFLKNIVIKGETLDLSLLGIILKLLIPLFVTFFVYKIIKLFLLKWINKSSFSDAAKERTSKYIKAVLRIFLLLLYFMIAGKVLGAQVSRYTTILINIINQPFFVSGSTEISVVTILMMIPVFYFASWIGKVTYKLIDTSITDNHSITDERKFTFANLVKYGITVIAMLVGLSVIGIDLSSIAVIFGVLGLGLGFGLQNIISNFFAGIVIIISRPVKVGDLISMGENRGFITRINTISTVMTTLWNETLIIPNSLLISDVIFNDSYSDKSIIIKNPISVSYKTNLDVAKDVLIGIGEVNPFIKRGTFPEVRLKEFGDSGIGLTLYITVTDVSDRNAAMSWNNFEIWREFKKHKIEIPYPQMDLHIKEKPQE